MPHVIGHLQRQNQLLIPLQLEQLKQLEQLELLILEQLEGVVLEEMQVAVPIILLM
jgi:hypothetical protein